VKKISSLLTVALCILLSTPTSAQQTKGTVVMVAGSGEVKADNDQATVTFFIEEQDKDKITAAARVNRKMKEGTEIVKKADPQAKLATRSYFTYPVYSDVSISNKTREITGWRVGQYLDLVTKNIQQLAETVAAAQKLLALNGINFELSDEAIQRLDTARLNLAYKNMQERAQTIATAMGRNINDASLESLDVDGAGIVRPEPRVFAATSMMAKGAATVPETSFEAGESTLSARVIGRVKFN
jgi:uncharacterized protein YggE